MSVESYFPVGPSPHLGGEPVHGRGASGNPPNRFECLHYEPEPEDDRIVSPSPATEFFRDGTRSIIAYNDSPDVGFGASINPYRGCEHGCSYCYARPNHEFLGFSAGLDFETKIMVKEDAPELLRRELASLKWEPQVVSVSGVTDCYQPIERRLQLTRRCLEVFLEFRNPIVIVTKSHLVTRDLDLLAELASHQAALVFLSITTLDSRLSRTMEPRASQPAGRLSAIKAANDAGVPVGVMVAPVIPGLTDHEMPAILAEAAAAGARFASYVPLRLPLGVGPLFQKWLENHVPEKKDKVLSRIRGLRDGRLNCSEFGRRMRGEGPMADLLSDLFHISCRKTGLNNTRPVLSPAAFRRPGRQRLLFE